MNYIITCHPYGGPFPGSSFPDRKLKVLLIVFQNEVCVPTGEQQHSDLTSNGQPEQGLNLNGHLGYGQPPSLTAVSLSGSLLLPSSNPVDLSNPSPSRHPPIDERHHHRHSHLQTVTQAQEQYKHLQPLGAILHNLGKGRIFFHPGTNDLENECQNKF